jgi:hypothetical protein
MPTANYLLNGDIPNVGLLGMSFKTIKQNPYYITIPFATPKPLSNINLIGETIRTIF